MPLVNAKCTNCGAALKVDNKLEAAVCEYCGSAYIVEKAIQNYNYYVTNNINADNVFIMGKGDVENERLLKNAETNERFKDNNKATQIYQQVTEDYPYEYRGWLGLALIQSSSFNNVDLDFREFSDLSSNINKAIMCAPAEKARSIQSQWNTYLDKHTLFLNKKKLQLCNLQNQNEKIDNLINDTNRNISDYKESSNSALNKAYKLRNNQNSDGYRNIDGAMAWGILLVWGAGLTVGGIFWQKWLIAIGVAILILALLVIIYKKYNKSQLKQLENEEKRYNSLINDETQKLDKLNQEKCNIENEVNCIRNRYNIQNN